jgi:hypothetical protein
MAENYKVLGQVALPATSLTAVYTVPASTEAVISSIVVCNRDSSSHKYRLSIAVAGASDDPKQYIAYDVNLLPESVDDFTIGATLGAADVVRAYADAAQVSVSVFGTEIT